MENNDKLKNRFGIVGFRHTGLVVNNLEKSLDFYESFLGLRVLQKHRDDSDYISEVTGFESIVAEYVKLEIPGGHVLELLSYPSHKYPNNKKELIEPGEAHLAFQVESIDKAYSSIISAKIPVVSKPVTSSENIAKVFFCLDPDNYRIEFVEMLTNNYSWNPNNNG
jgi:catechol 2,3-dioxygenase-like lactoylglutathione lyase family enzyme